MKRRLIVMNRLPIDEEEMALRRDEDYIASLKMIGEGGASFGPYDWDEDESATEKKLPDVYQ